MIKLPEAKETKFVYHGGNGAFECGYESGWNAAIAEVQRLNAAAQPVSDGWVKCSERLPEADGHYLVFANASTLDGYCDHNDIACYQDGKWSNEFNWLVTHWMPLPAAPGGQENEQ